MSDELKAAAIRLVDKGYDDAKPAIAPLVDTFANVFRATAFLTGAPEWAIKSLPVAYHKCMEKVAAIRDSIPEVNRQPPKDWVIHSIVQNIPATDDAEELQDLFANLMCAASDDRRSRLVRTAFADVIHQLAPADARLLKWMAGRLGSPNGSYLQRADAKDALSPTDFEQLNVSIENLVRVGILQTVRRVAGSLVQQGGFPGSYSSPEKREIAKLEYQVKTLRRALDSVGQVVRHKLTAFGVDFIRACVLPPSGAPVEPSDAPEE